MIREDIVERFETTKINWKEDRDPSRKKVTRKKGRKGTETIWVPQKSFFTFFD